MAGLDKIGVYDAWARHSLRELQPRLPLMGMPEMLGTLHGRLPQPPMKTGVGGRSLELRERTEAVVLLAL